MRREPSASQNCPYSSTCAGRGISFWVALQDLSQLDGLYGLHKARTIRNNMGAKVFFRPEDYATAKSISDTWALPQATATLRHSEEAVLRGTLEQAVAVLTPRELMEMGDRDTIFFYKNLKPGRRRLEHWGFHCLKNGASHHPLSNSCRTSSRLCFRCHQAPLRQPPPHGRETGDGRAFPST